MSEPQGLYGADTVHLVLVKPGHSAFESRNWTLIQFPLCSELPPLLQQSQPEQEKKMGLKSLGSSSVARSAILGPSVTRSWPGQG